MEIILPVYWGLWWAHMGPIGNPCSTNERISWDGIWWWSMWVQFRKHQTPRGLGNLPWRVIESDRKSIKDCNREDNFWTFWQCGMSRSFTTNTLGIPQHSDMKKKRRLLTFKVKDPGVSFIKQRLPKLWHIQQDIINKVVPPIIYIYIHNYTRIIP